jgi:hypothetical protein
MNMAMFGYYPEFGMAEFSGFHTTALDAGVHPAWVSPAYPYVNKFSIKETFTLT